MKNNYKKKKQSRFGEYVSVHKIPILIGVLCTLFAVGSGLLGYGAKQYIDSNRQTYVVAAVKSMQDGNFHKAQTFFMQSLKNNAVEAYPFLAWIAAKSGNFFKALDYCRKAADEDPDSTACYEIMGDLALLGYGNAQGAGSALYYFDEYLKEHKDLDEDSLNALKLKIYEDAVMYCTNNRDYVRMVNEAAALGSSMSLMFRGDIEFLGTEHDISPRSAKKSWESAKAQGEIEAITRLATLYFYGYGINRNISRALQMYEDASEKGDPVASYSLALIKFRQGGNTAYNKGMKLLRIAAKRDYGPALTAVGVMALSQNIKSKKIIYAAADIFKQAYECGDSTGGILYAIMTMNGDGVALDKTKAFSILYDIKSRGLNNVGDLLNFFNYHPNLNTKKLFSQAIELCRAMYLGDVVFKVGAPEAPKYHERNPDSSVNYYTEMSKDPLIKAEDKSLLGKNFVTTLDKSEDITIEGEKILYPKLYEILEVYNPTTGARNFVPDIVLKIDASIPSLPHDYDKFELDLKPIEEML